jgi:hypothetical protein
MARKKKQRNWRAESPWPILPQNAGCPCPKRGGGDLVHGSCYDCKYMLGVAYPYMGFTTIRCGHPKQAETLGAWTQAELERRNATRKGGTA